MDLSQGKFVDDTDETILVNDKVVNGYGSDTPHVARLRYGVSDAPSTYAKQQEEVGGFLETALKGLSGYSEKDIAELAQRNVGKNKSFVTSFMEELNRVSPAANVASNIITAGATTATSMYYGAEMAGATLPLWMGDGFLGLSPTLNNIFNEKENGVQEYISNKLGEQKKKDEAIKETVKEIHKRSNEVAQKIGETLGVGQDSVGAFIGQTTGSVLASLGICYLTKNPALTAAIFALPTYENVLGTSVEQGRDLRTSANIALASATATGFLENWGFQNFIENIATKTVRSAILKTQATETIEEVSQQIAEDIPLIFWAKDKQFVDENGNIKWNAVLVDLASAGFGGWLGGGFGAAGGAVLTQRKINSTIDNLVKTEKYTPGEATTIVQYLFGNDEKARATYENEVVGKQIGETPTYEEFILANTELKQARNVMDNITQDMSDPQKVESVVDETMNEVLDPVNLPNESLDEYARMVKDSGEQLNAQMLATAKEERSKYDVRDIVKAKGADTRTIDATREAVQSFAEAEAETFGVTPREALEGKTLTVANLADNSGLSPDEKQQILQQSGLANADTVVAKESGVAPTQDEIDEAYAMMESEKEQGYVPNEYMQEAQNVAQRMNEIDAEEQANGVPEYTAPTININGVERPTTNSNGNPIAKSEKSLRYFYNWFGDSKVVDEQGRPLVVYHGTNAEFDTFKKIERGVGYWFGPKQTAEEYAKERYEKFGGEEKIYPVYLKLEKIADISTESGRNEIKSFSDEFNDKELWNYARIPDGNIASFVLGNMDFAEFLGGEKGYDGIKMNNGVYVSYFRENIKSTSNRGTYSLTDNNIYNQSAYAGSRVDYDPRYFIPNVRGGWTKAKILRYLKENGSLRGVGNATRKIAEFDSLEDFKEHMFYHGAKYGTSGSMKPSITMSDRQVEQVGGGGYGEKYWAISLTKSKKVAANIGTASGSGRVYPVLLVKNAKVIEMQELEDSADLEDYIERLYSEGVDAVWIGDKNGGEQELAVINPRAIVNLGTSDFYSAYKLGQPENPIKIKSDEEIKNIYDYAKELVKEYPKTMPDEKMEEVRRTVFWQQEQQPRAFINFQDEANILVGMLNSADISALPHEMVHGFTRLHVQNCIKYGKFESIKGIMDYFGVTDPMQLITNVDIQERLARMGIKYVQESEAPTAGLRRYFEMFKRFGKKLVSSWQSKGLIDQDALPDEVRNFFDSLLGKKKTEKIDTARIAEQKADIIQAIKRIRAGEAVDISGLPISEVRKLMKVLQSRVPRMPQNLKNALIQAGGIDKEWAKNFDFEAASGEEKNYQLFKRNGLINSEDSLISFLESEGFITPTEVEDYDSKSEQWDRVMEAMENMDNTYREQDIGRVMEREGLEDAIQQARDIISGVGAEDAFEVIENIDALKGRVVAEKEYLDSLERRVKNLDKDYKKLYDGLLKDQARDFKQDTKEQVKQAKEEIKDYRNQVIDFIRKQDLDLKDKAKLMSVVKKANTKASFEKVITEVKERAADLYRKEQVRLLSDLIQKEVSTKRPALKNQKYAYEENKLFSDLRDWNKLNKADAGIRYEAMHNDEDFMGNLTREDEIRLLFLEYKALGADSSPQLLNTLLDYIEIAKNVGKEARNEQEYQKAMSLDDTKNEMLHQLQTRKGKPTVYIKFVSNLYSSLYTMMGKDIADKYELETVQNKANIESGKHIDKVVKEVMKLYGSKSKGDFLNVIAELGKKVATITTVNNNIDTPLSKVGITHDLSTLQIMDIYNSIKNEKSRDDYYYWYGKDQIDRLVSNLTTNEMLFADMMMESVDERYESVNEVFIKNYYTDLPKVDNYWMATSEHKELKTVFDMQGDFNQQSPSFLKERVKTRVLPRPENAYSKYTKHIKGTYWVTEMANKQVELLNAIDSLRVKNAIQNKFGKDVYNALHKQVEALSFGGLMDDIDFVTGVIDKSINNVVMAKISLGIPVFTGQLSSVGLYAENMGTAEWGIEFTKGLLHPVETYKFMKENVGDFLENRFGGGYDETVGHLLREVEEGKGKYTLSPKTKYNVVNALSYFVRTGDIGAIIYGGYPRLKQLLKTMPKAEAIQQFEMETLRGQQSNVTASKSAFQQRKGMTRVFTSFRNFQYQAVRKIVDSVYGYMNGEVSAAQAGKTIALYALYSPIAYELFRQIGNALFIGSDAFKELGNKLFNTILFQELSIVPIVNDVMNYAISKYQGKYARSGLRTVGVDDLFRAVDKAFKKRKDVYDYAEIVSPFIEMMTGAPSQRIISTTKKVLEKYK